MSHYRILHTVWGLAVGGVGTVVRNHATHLGSEFSSIVLSVTPNRSRLEEFLVNDLEVRFLDHRGKRDSLRTLHRAIRFVKQHEIDLVHTNHPLDRFYFALVACLTDVPHVTTFHNVSRPPPVMGGRGFGFSIGDRVSRNWVDHYIAVTNAVREAQSEGRDIPRDKISVVYSGIAPERAGLESKSDIRQRLGVSEKAGPILLNVGRLHAQKGQKYLIPAMKEIVRHMPQAVLLIAGDGGERSDLEEVISGEGMNDAVKLLGFRTDVSGLLKAADVFVFPSLKEGLGMAAVEAQLAGVPVVAARTAALEEVVEDGRTGYLVPPRDSQGLASAVLKLLSDPVQAEEMRQRARRNALGRFSASASAARLGEVYKAVIDSKSNHKTIPNRARVGAEQP